MSKLLLTTLFATLLSSILFGSDSGDPIADALKLSAQDNKPVLILIRNQRDIGSLDAAHWLESDALKPLLQKFHSCVLWNNDPVLKAYPYTISSGLLTLAAKGPEGGEGEWIASEGAPLTRADFEKSLNVILEHPRPLAPWDFVRIADDPAHGPEADRAVEILRKAGRAYAALPIWKTIANARAGGDVTKAKALAETTAEIAFQARVHTLVCFQRSLSELKAFKPSQKSPATQLIGALRESCGPMVFSKEPRQQPLSAALEKLQNQILANEKPESAEAISLLQNELEQQRKEIREAALKFVRDYPQNFEAQLMLLQFYAESEHHDEKSDSEARDILHGLLGRALTAGQCLRSAEFLVAVAVQMNLEGDYPALARKIVAEAPAGRGTASALLDLADAVYQNGHTEEAIDLWNRAEMASGNGESPTLYAAAVAMCALATGDSLPLNTKWAQRDVLDVVVLVQDMPSFAKAISAWTDKVYFPVLFQDDLYAPKFIAAFKPSHVFSIPPAPANITALSAGDIRRAILASWNSRKRAQSADPTDTDLRNRLKSLKVEPLGVVFGDGTSGETAGGIALAAGRFQSFEFLPIPKLKPDAEHCARPTDYLSTEAARTLAADVAAGLTKWNLPRANRWAYVTLAAPYPFRYNGNADGFNFGNTYALDDLLGRDRDGLRIAVTGRLLGDAARSAYQAACSLFLTPESALLFNTYGTNPRSIWGKYRMTFSEEALRSRLAVTHIWEDTANIESFRHHLGGWNRDQLIAINSSGGATDWSIGGGGGMSDDFPVGVPTAIHVTHSGSASDPYNPDTLAGRAIWGGAFWYFGSVAEPFLTAFEPPAYYGRRIADGVPLAVAFRERTSQEFWFPWRLMIVGDPQFCLRKTPAKRKAYDGSQVVAENEIILSGPQETPAFKDWAHALRVARWRSNRELAQSLIAQRPNDSGLNGEDMAIVLEEHLVQNNCQAAVNLWQHATEEARGNYAARVYARRAVSTLLDEALAAEDFAAMQAHLDELFSTKPPSNFIERWLNKLSELAEKKMQYDVLAGWLTKAAEAHSSFHTALTQRLSRAKLNSLYLKPSWSADEKKEALECFAKDFAVSVKSKIEPKVMEQRLGTFIDKYEKAAGESRQATLKNVESLFAAESAESKMILPMLNALKEKSAPK